jgi:outer membrane lipoprotein carrier protein LolA
MRRRGMLAALLPFAAAAAQAADPLDAVRARLADVALLRGEFTQTKRLAGFRNPLRSSGRFVLVRGRGVLWLTLSPFASTLVVTPDRIEALDAQGQRLSRLDARAEPALRSINQLLLATLAADLAPLRELFSIDAELVGPAGWRLVLRASDAMLARQLARITLAGERHVHEVQLEERNGDRTEIVFSGWSSAGAPSASEQALLATTR